MPSTYNIVTQARLGILLHLDEDVIRDRLLRFPLAGYAAEYWVEHAILRACRKMQRKGRGRFLTGEGHIPHFGSGYGTLQYGC